MTAKRLAAEHLPQVRAQYEDFPYPVRNPEDEQYRLLEVHGSGLDHITYHCFEGARDVDARFRVLDAGGGTGDNAIYLAEQLRERGGQVTYVDFSEASLAIARRRAEVRKLENITFLHDSLLNLPELGLEPFDFIVCNGVLHHLSDPDAGLAALTSVLKADGAMSLMVYAKYGRLGVYALQEALKILAPPSLPMAERVGIAKRVLNDLPKRNWFRHSDWFLRELQEFGDPGIYDLLLHEQDRAYSITELYEWTDRHGLHVLRFLFKTGADTKVYDAASHLKDAELAARVNALPPRERQAALELLTGGISKHSVYAAPSPRHAPMPPERPDMVPFISQSVFPGNAHALLAEYVQAKGQPGGVVAVGNPQHKTLVKLACTPHLLPIVRAMDGKRSVREIFAHVRAAAPSADDQTLMAEFLPLFIAMNEADWMFLRAPHVRPIGHDAIRARQRPVGEWAKRQ